MQRSSHSSPWINPGGSWLILMILSHPVWQAQRAGRSIAQFAKDQDWIFDALDPLYGQTFKSRWEALQGLQGALAAWQGRDGKWERSALSAVFGRFSI